MTIGERLKKWRKEYGLTTSEIAAKTGVSAGGLSEYENDKKLIGSKTLLTLYEFYKIDINWILTGEKYEELINEEQIQLFQYFKICDRETKEDIIRFVKRCALSQKLNNPEIPKEKE